MKYYFVSFHYTNEESYGHGNTVFEWNEKISEVPYFSPKIASEEIEKKTGINNVVVLFYNEIENYVKPFKDEEKEKKE